MFTIIAFVPPVKRRDHHLRRHFLCQGNRKGLEVSRDESIHIGFEQGVIEVKQECDGHGISGFSWQSCPLR